MGFIYKIEVGEECYIGSTTTSLKHRISSHNTAIKKKCNSPLYKFCREHNIEKIICQELVEFTDDITDDAVRLIEQEYINKFNPTLNGQRAYRTEDELREQKKNQAKKDNAISNKIRINCPICDKNMLRTSLNNHKKNKHN